MSSVVKYLRINIFHVVKIYFIRKCKPYFNILLCSVRKAYFRDDNYIIKWSMLKYIYLRLNSIRRKPNSFEC